MREFIRIDNVLDPQYMGNRRFFEPAPGRTWLVGANAVYAF